MFFINKFFGNKEKEENKDKLHQIKMEEFKRQIEEIRELREKIKKDYE
jgi:hypothetical protein